MLLGAPASFQDDAEDEELAVVPIDITVSAFKNIELLHSSRKFAKNKEVKTVEKQAEALNAAEAKAKREIQHIKRKQEVKKFRKAWWFEKFYWFVSSENYLVIAGHDPQQNRLILKRYADPWDVVVHADVPGAILC